MSLKTFLFGLALGGVAMNLYAKARPARGGDAGEPVRRDPSAAAGPIGSGRVGRTDDLLSPGTDAPAEAPAPEVVAAGRF